MSDRPRLVTPDDAVLVIVDIQERLAAAMAHRAEVVAAAVRLVRAAALLGWLVATSESVMYEAAGRAATDEFRALLRIVKGA